MPRVNALINKGTLAHICPHIGVTTAFLAQQTHISDETISKWLTIDNAAVPTLNLAKMLAKVLKIPLGCI